MALFFEQLCMSQLARLVLCKYSFAGCLGSLIYLSSIANHCCIHVHYTWARVHEIKKNIVVMQALIYKSCNPEAARGPSVVVLSR